MDSQISFNPIQSLSAATKQEKEAARLKKAVQAFEAFFITQLLQEMRKTVPQNSLGAGASSHLYQGMLDEQLGFTLAQGQGLGLAQALLRQLQQSSQQFLPPKNPES